MCAITAAASLRRRVSCRAPSAAATDAFLQTCRRVLASGSGAAGLARPCRSEQLGVWSASGPRKTTMATAMQSAVSGGVAAPSGMAGVALQRRPRPFVGASARCCSTASSLACTSPIAHWRLGNPQAAWGAAPRQLATHTSKVDVRARATKTSQEQQFAPKTAREAIETATRLQNEQKQFDEAVRLYVLAMEMQPSEDEARAALYNMGCALAKQKQWARATECIVQAVNKYSLKLSVALKVGTRPSSSACGADPRPATHVASMGSEPASTPYLLITRRTTTCGSCGTAASGSTRWST